MSTLARRTPMRRTAIKRRQAAPAAPWADGREQRLHERAERALGNAPAAARAAVIAPVRALPAAVVKAIPLRSEAYRRAVAALPCCWCGAVGYSQHAHANEGKGLGLKTDDRTGFPLCAPRMGVEGCHAAFDQCRLLSGGREAHRAAAREWGAWTRAEILRLGMWPARLPQWSPNE